MFMPVGTQGSVKGLTSKQLQDVNAGVVLGIYNSYPNIFLPWNIIYNCMLIKSKHQYKINHNLFNKKIAIVNKC